MKVWSYAYSVGPFETSKCHDTHNVNSWHFWHCDIALDSLQCYFNGPIHTCSVFCHEKSCNKKGSRAKNCTVKNCSEFTLCVSWHLLVLSLQLGYYCPSDLFLNFISDYVTEVWCHTDNFSSSQGRSYKQCIDVPDELIHQIQDYLAHMPFYESTKNYMLSWEK